MSAATLPAPAFGRRTPVAAAPVRGPAGITALWAMFVGYPLWWCLGLGAMSWFVFAIPMAWALFRAERIRVPRGFGVWLLFLAWVLALSPYKSSLPNASKAVSSRSLL